MSGHWSEKSSNEARLFGDVKEVAEDPKGRQCTKQRRRAASASADSSVFQSLHRTLLRHSG